MRVFFIFNFDWTPPEKRQVTIAFKAGRIYFVRKICAQEAFRLGKAVAAK